MKITIFGLTISSSWGNGHATPYRAVLRALKRKGHHVTFFEKDVPYYASRRDFTLCDFCELRLYPDWEEVRAQARACAGESDVVICASYCPGGARIIDEVMDLAGPAKIFYDLDTPITLRNLSFGDLDYIRAEQIPAFDSYLSFTGGRILEELVHRWGARRACPLYGCVDPDVHVRVPVQDEFRCDFSYMGTYAPDRQQKLEELFLAPARRLSEGRFVLAGSLYPREMQFPGNVRHIEHVTPSDHSALYSSSRATLNITRDEMANSGYCPSGRFFEAAACGAPIVSDWFEGLNTFFETDGSGAELLVVRSEEDVVSALRLPEEELARIAARARERTLAEHTGERRAEELLRYLEAARSSSALNESEMMTAKGEVA